ARGPRAVGGWGADQVVYLGGAVVAGGAQVRDDFAAVIAPPHEAVVGELGDLRPRHLGGVEILDATKAQDLRQGSGITEDVGDPADRRRAAAQRCDLALAVE